MKEWNNELSRKLEAQTQRLELLTAQSMATGNVPTRPPDPRSIRDNNTLYADEGDEVSYYSQYFLFRIKTILNFSIGRII